MNLNKSFLYNITSQIFKHAKKSNKRKILLLTKKSRIKALNLHLINIQGLIKCEV